MKNNLMYFTEDQRYEYVKMMKHCGFTGIQVTDMCSARADDTVVYQTNGDYVFNSEEALATFEKYYTIYADPADCCDRVIGHYYDPGNLSSTEENAYFAGMLRDKFQAVNPDSDFGISCWVDAYDKDVFINEQGNNITLYEQGYRDNPESQYTALGTAKPGDF